MSAEDSEGIVTADRLEAELRTIWSARTLERSMPDAETSDHHLRSFNELAVKDLSAKAESFKILDRVKDLIFPGQALFPCYQVSAPYDREWTLGSAIRKKDRGEVYSIASSEGHAIAGVGFFLKASSTRDFAITPQGTYSFSCSMTDNTAFRGSGGLGVMVLKTGGSGSLLSRTGEVWRVRGGEPGPSVITGGGNIGDVKEGIILPPGEYFSSLLFPVNFSLKAGEQASVWIWAWQTRESKGNLSILAMRMPAVRVCSYDPVRVPVK